MASRVSYFFSQQEKELNSQPFHPCFLNSKGSSDILIDPTERSFPTSQSISVSKSHEISSGNISVSFHVDDLDVFQSTNEKTFQSCFVKKKKKIRVIYQNYTKFSHCNYQCSGDGSNGDGVGLNINNNIFQNIRVTSSHLMLTLIIPSLACWFVMMLLILRTASFRASYAFLLE